jgi:NifU-like protein involved in Fe-S cluster formation
MGADPYSPLVRKLFAAPAHVAASAGQPGAGHTAFVEGQGVSVRLNASVTGDAVVELSFRARGCPHFLAACEWLCQRYSGKAASELDVFKPEEIMQTLAIPAAKSARILVLEDAVRLLRACPEGLSPP